jgi:ribulose-5-phosphate 4-epimerase/fuculose-1-phosphate aldolase
MTRAHAESRRPPIIGLMLTSPLLPVIPGVAAASPQSPATARADLLEPAGGSRGRCQDGDETVPDNLTEVIEQLAVANRILGHEGVIDAFGHVSIRHPYDPGRYLLSRSRSPLLVEPDDIIEYTLDSEPVAPPSSLLYSERVIHGCIYQARSDVMAVCHHHAPAVMPFCITGTPIVPVFHIGGAIGDKTPFWDQHDEFGDTNLLVVKPEEGQSLARALGPHSVVLMKRHGATVVGGSLRELVSRSIYLCQNAEYQLRSLTLGKPQPLHPGEITLAGAINLKTTAADRTWEYWSSRLKHAGLWPPHRTVKAKRAAPAKRVRAAAKSRGKAKRKR